MLEITNNSIKLFVVSEISSSRITQFLTEEGQRLAFLSKSTPYAHFRSVTLNFKDFIRAREC